MVPLQKSRSKAFNHWKRQLRIRLKYSRKRSVTLKHLERLTLCLIALTLSYSVFPRSRELENAQRNGHNPGQKNVVSFKSLTFGDSTTQRSDGTSLVAACQNGHEALRYTIPSWIKVNNLSEIVLVDWGSTPSLRFLVEELDRMKNAPPIYVLQVENVTAWEVSRAFNLGFRAAHFSHVLRVDCDIKVRDDFLETHALHKSAYFTGGWHLERSEADEPLGNVLFMDTNQVLLLGGYDERLQNCSCEHDDLLLRLQQTEFKRLNIDYNKLVHVSDVQTNANINLMSSHEDKAIREIQAQVFQTLVRNLTSWTHKSAHGIYLFQDKATRKLLIPIAFSRHKNVLYRTVQSKMHIPSFLETVPSSTKTILKHKVVNALLQDNCQFPSEMSEALPLPSKAKLFAKLKTSKGFYTRFCKQKVIVIHCVGDLVSRLSVLISGLAFARHTGRTPVLIWEKEPDHLNVSFHTLFSHVDNLVVVDALRMPLPLDIKGWEEKGMSTFDFTADTYEQTGFIRNNPSLHIYVKSNIRLSSAVVRHTSKHAFRDEFSRMVVHPVVDSMIHTLVDHGLEKSLGIHISSLQMIPSDGNSTSWRAFGSVLGVEVSEMRQRYGALPPILTDANVEVRNLLRREILYAIFMPFPSFPPTFDNTQANQDFIRILAFSRTLIYLSNTNDTFSSLVTLLREDSS